MGNFSYTKELSRHFFLSNTNRIRCKNFRFFLVNAKNQSHGSLFIIAAPTGAGKTTLTNLIISRHPHIKRAVTYTTRKARPGEQHAVDYFFVTEDEFLTLKNNNFFLETTKYDQSWYGSPSDILHHVSAGGHYIIITDWPGAKTISTQITTTNPEINFECLWITVPSRELLVERLKDRYTHDHAALERRLKLFDAEIDRELQERFFLHHVINDDLESTYKRLCTLMKIK